RLRGTKLLGSGCTRVRPQRGAAMAYRLRCPTCGKTIARQPLTDESILCVACGTLVSVPPEERLVMSVPAGPRPDTGSPGLSSAGFRFWPVAATLAAAIVIVASLMTAVLGLRHPPVSAGVSVRESP